MLFRGIDLSGSNHKIGKCDVSGANFGCFVGGNTGSTKVIFTEAPLDNHQTKKREVPIISDD